MRALLHALVRVLAAFGVLNLALGALHPSFDGNWLWLGVAAEGGFGALLVLAFALAVLGWPLWRDRRLASSTARLVVLAVAIGCAADVIGFYRALAAGGITTSIPVPLSLGSALVLLAFAARPPRPMAGGRLRGLALHGLAAATWVALLIASVAVTDYARPADAIIVFGARVLPSGQPSDALRDRTLTAIALHHRGLAPVLVFSGGKGDDAPVSEPEAMRRLAIAEGVPPDAIVLDETGVNTAATVAATAALARRHGWQRLLMVTHDYHCARVKLESARAGLNVFTVPAVQARPLLGKPYFVLREGVAWVWYWLRPLKTRPSP
ncbi:MAG: YdcF family protein [Myxococcales bacterium]|nr:YdcF family protein [Myxococcales bacterium]